MEHIIDEPGVIGVGYQGQTIDQFVSSLEEMGVTCVIDVRLTPLSRKRGFSKSSLAQTLASRGISYEHARALGNPKENREGLAGDEEQMKAARMRYADELEAADARALLDELANRAQTERLALLCFEAETERCHRHVLLEEVQKRQPTSPGAVTDQRGAE